MVRRRHGQYRRLEEALALDEQACDYRMRQLAERVTRYDVAAWGDDFLHAVREGASA